MVLLSETDADTTAYLTAHGLPPLLESALAEFGYAYEEGTLNEPPLRFFARFLKENHPRRIAEREVAMRRRIAEWEVARRAALQEKYRIDSEYEALGTKEDFIEWHDGSTDEWDAAMPCSEEQAVAEEDRRQEAEVVKMLSAFEGKSTISIDELRVCMAQRGWSHEKVDTFFWAIDKNADGTLSREELKAGLLRDAKGEPTLMELLAKGLRPAEREALATIVQQQALAAEAAAVVSAIDTDGDGCISADELRAHMMQRGWPQEKTDALFKSLDEDGDGKLSAAELAAGLQRLRTGEPSYKELMAVAAPPAGVDFADLATAPDGCLRIADTANRAITLEQAERIVKHAAQRLGCEMEVVVTEVEDYDFMYIGRFDVMWKQVRDDGERWLGARPQAGLFVQTRLTFDAVNLYDCARYVIGPSTLAQKCSMVELMATEEQPPDYFVSHFWAEPIVDFLKCLLEHSWARGLESKAGRHNGQAMGGLYDEGDPNEPHPLYLGGRSPRYWVCAHANNQHDLASEIVDDLSQTSFARAMKIAKGTVSVVDQGGGSFGRIWCVFELFKSLSEAAEGSYTYDLVTATEWFEKIQKHGAVAIIDGLSAQQSDADDKREHESAFPLALIETGISFKCLDGKASMPKDEERIKAAIGDGSTLLDETVHGVNASAALLRGLEAGGETRVRFLEAVRRGHVRKLQLDLAGSEADTEENCWEVLGALDAEAIQEVALTSREVSALPEGFTFSKCKALTSVNLESCRGLTALPEGLFAGSTALTSVSLSHCRGLTALPEGLFAGSTALTSVDLRYTGLFALPEGLFAGLPALTSVNLYGCYGLTALPEGFFAGLTALTSVSLGGCEGVTPAMIEELRARGIEVEE